MGCLINRGKPRFTETHDLPRPFPTLFHTLTIAKYIGILSLLTFQGMQLFNVHVMHASAFKMTPVLMR